MATSESLKTIVMEKYGQIARQTNPENCGCNCGCSDDGLDYSVMSESYNQIDGYVAEADLGLGCGVPTQYANIQPGQTVLDLGSGAGNDVFVARREVSENGYVIGVDMTAEMNEKANRNLKKSGYQNVEFRLGDIENLPVADSAVDVVISNCVLNLVPNKTQAFAEIWRVLKPGGHFCVSDIVVSGELPPALKQAAEMYAGCVAGASGKDEYIRIIYETGFEQVRIEKDRKIELGDNLLRQFLSDDELETFRKSEFGIFSITVYGTKPM